MIHASNPATAAFIFLAVAAYAFGVLVFLRPVWTRAVELVEQSGSHALRLTLMALTFLLVFFSAWVTEILGVHAIFGAFLFGLAMPRGHRFTLEVRAGGHEGGNEKWAGVFVMGCRMLVVVR